MAASHKRVQRDAESRGVSPVSFSVCELDYVKALAEFRRADELDAEAVYYGHRATQARDPGCRGDPLPGMATDRVVMAQRMGSQLAHLHLTDGSGASVTSTWCPVGAASPAERIDLPQPDRKDHQHDHG